MENEFKYIPYDQNDDNLQGLVKNGNVYNLSRSMSGIFLPDNPDTDVYQAEKDLKYLKEMYPQRVRRINVMVEDECDKMEYDGSPMFAEYPDAELIRKTARDVYEKLDDNDVDIFQDVEDTQSEPPYVPKSSGAAGSMMRNLIETLVCNEFHYRRERYRKCRRKFYL